jgi:hypothetical protein
MNSGSCRKPIGGRPFAGRGKPEDVVGVSAIRCAPRYGEGRDGFIKLKLALIRHYIIPKYCVFKQLLTPLNPDQISSRPRL